MFSRNLMLSFIDKVTAGKQRLALFIWNISSTANVASLTLSPPTACVFDILDIIQFFTMLNQGIFRR